jgi:hypothetical protein
MKKIILLLSIIGLGTAACNSNKGAYEENEKKTQDSIDNLNKEQGFGDLLIKDSLHQDSIDKGLIKE